MTGGSSFIVSLPKEWVASRNIQKGDQLGLIPQLDGSLVITDKLAEEPDKVTKILDIDKIETERHLFRLLVGAYIMGYSEIVVSSSKDIKPSLHDTIVDFTKLVIGPEIIEENSHSVTIKDLLNPMEMPFEKTTRRMHVLAINMGKNVMDALFENEKGIAEAVINRDEGVNRLHWLVSRQINMVLRDLTLTRKMDTSLQDAFFYYMISRFLERISDHIVLMAINAISVIEQEQGRLVFDLVNKACVYAMDMVTKSANAWFKKELKPAQETIDSMMELAKQCDGIRKAKLDLDDVESWIALGHIAENIRRIGAYAVDISETVIDAHV